MLSVWPVVLITIGRVFTWALMRAATCNTTNADSIRILLDQAASDHLTATGGSAFVVVGKASLPDDPGRWALHLVACPMATAAAACEIALGQRKPGPRIKTPVQVDSNSRSNTPEVNP